MCIGKLDVQRRMQPAAKLDFNLAGEHGSARFEVVLVFDVGLPRFIIDACYLWS